MDEQTKIELGKKLVENAHQLFIDIAGTGLTLSDFLKAKGLTIRKVRKNADGDFREIF